MKRALIAAIVLFPLTVSAGYRELEAFLVRVDTAEDAASKACWRAIYGAFKGNDAILKTQSRARFAKAFGADGFAGMSGWPAERLAPLRRDNDGLDAKVLVYCDAPNQIVEVVVAAGTGGLTDYGRFRLSGVEITRKRATMVGELALNAAYIGFSL